MNSEAERISYEQFGEERSIKCLDHGHVKLIDVMGDDATIVRAARNSIKGMGVKATSDDRALIRYLFRKWHTTPFESVVFTFEMKLPIFVARQLVRHRTQSLNELSARYSELPEEFYVPEEAAIQYQAEKNRQGRKDEALPNAREWQEHFRGEAIHDFENYRDRLNDGMARELARINLPLSTYTQWWTTLNLHNLFHMLGLRKDSHAQMECRVFADALGRFVELLLPHTWESFCDFRLNALTLSASDIEALRDLFFEGTPSHPIAPFGDHQPALINFARSFHVSTDAQKDYRPSGLPKWFKTKREHDEFLEKMARIFGPR